MTVATDFHIVEIFNGEPNRLHGLDIKGDLNHAVIHVLYAAKDRDGFTTR